MRLPKAGTIEIVPSVFACDCGRLADEIAEVEAAGVKMVQVDGGISPETAIQVVRCGTDTLVADSAIFAKSDRAAAIGKMRKAANLA